MIMRTAPWIVVLATILVHAGHAQAPPEGPPEVRGRWIAEQAERRDTGFSDSETEITMRLVGDDGRVRERRLTWRTLENPDPGDGDKSLVVFHEPRDIAGTAFLTHTHIGREDDQWLYLPALKRVKRIAATNMTGSFMGSELAYEDLLSDEVEKFDYRWLRDEPCGELSCHVLERVPRYEGTGYSRQLVWMDVDEYRPVRIEYYDLRERLEKTLLLDEYALYGDRFWRAHEYRMVNHLTGRQTQLSFAPYELGAGLTEQDFDPGALSRLR